MLTPEQIKDAATRLVDAVTPVLAQDSHDFARAAS